MDLDNSQQMDHKKWYASVLASRQVGVSNHWTGIQNGTVEWKMEWNAVIAHSMDNTEHVYYIIHIHSNI